jgi:SET domain-containing protein
MKRSKYQIEDWGLKVKKSNAGLGLFATKDIPKGVCLIEYFGPEISEAEQYTSRSKYLFQINSKITIDGRARENIARYINHSCKPNCEVEIKNKRVYIFSIKKIKAGEELCYDYGKEYFDEHIKKGGCKCRGCYR